MNSKNSKRDKINWGTEEEYFPVIISVAPISDEDIESAAKLSPTQRLEWLLMMQKLLLKQFPRAK